MRRSKFFSLLKCESGATVIEYAFIASLISIAIVIGVTQVGDATHNNFNKINNGFK